MYVVGKCHCPACREAYRVARLDSEKRKREGRSLFVPAGPVRERWMLLRSKGMSNNEIERAAGLDHKVSRDLLNRHWRTGKPITRINRVTAEAVMAVRRRAPRAGTYVTAPDFPSMTLDLMALGYSAAWIAARLEMSYQGIEALMRQSVKASTYAKMVRLHGSTVTRAQESPEASRSRNYAAKRTGRRDIIDRDRAALMLDDGRPVHEVASELGCTARTVERIKSEREVLR